MPTTPTYFDINFHTAMTAGKTTRVERRLWADDYVTLTQA